MTGILNEHEFKCTLKKIPVTLWDEKIEIISEVYLPIQHTEEKNVQPYFIKIKITSFDSRIECEYMASKKQSPNKREFNPDNLSDEEFDEFTKLY